MHYLSSLSSTTTTTSNKHGHKTRRWPISIINDDRIEPKSQRTLKCSDQKSKNCMNVTLKNNWKFLIFSNRKSKQWKEKKSRFTSSSSTTKKNVDKFYDVVWILHFYFITLFFHLDHIAGDQNDDNGVCIRLINFFTLKQHCNKLFLHPI